MCARIKKTLRVIALLCCVQYSSSRSDAIKCAGAKSWIKLESGWVCTSHQSLGDNGVRFASFRGIPYAKQPLGELRFQKLQPADPWDILDASHNGPVCPQTDILYRHYFGPKEMSEACIHANVHVPIHALPIRANQTTRPVRNIQSPVQAGFDDDVNRQRLPILVFIHGGGFAFGSGDDDLHGPEHFMAKDVIVVTFNYRLGPMGFLSLNSSSIPGNNGLRDAITLLQWVKSNAAAFGGDPNAVTIGGQSAGAVMAHLLTLSKAAEGLFKRAIVMSGPALRSFYTTSPQYAQFVARTFLANLDIAATDPEEIHRELVDMPLERIVDAHAMLLEELGLLVFSPVQESFIPNVTTIIDKHPIAAIKEGRGNIPIIFGFTSAEAELFRYRLEELNMLKRLELNPIALAPIEILMTRHADDTLIVNNQLVERYYKGTRSTDGIIKWLTDMYFIYPSLKAAQLTATRKSAPVYLYDFSYAPDFNILRGTEKYNGTAHIEDLTYVFQPHSPLVTDDKCSPRDRDMSYWMTTLFTNFIKYSSPAGKEGSGIQWPALSDKLQEQLIDTPRKSQYIDITPEQQDLLRFGDSIFGKLR